MGARLDPRSLDVSPLARRAVETDAAVGGLARFAGAAVVPAKPVVLSLDDGTAWLVLDARDDPHVLNRTLTIPTGVRRQLRRIERTGARFDGLFVAHELPPSEAADIRVADLDKAEVLEKLAGPRLPDRKAEKIVSILSMAAAKTAAAAAAAGRAAVSALDSLDPAIFGVVTASGVAAPGELAAWFLLAHWS